MRRRQMVLRVLVIALIPTALAGPVAAGEVHAPRQSQPAAHTGAASAPTLVSAAAANHLTRRPAGQGAVGLGQAEPAPARREYILIAYGVAISIGAMTIIAAVLRDRTGPKR